MIHGGAGAMDNVKTDGDAVRYLESQRVILELGRTILAKGGSALEAHQAVVPVTSGFERVRQAAR